MNCKITVLPNNVTFETTKGENLLIALARNKFFVTASCGGKGNCGKCKVALLSGIVSGCEQDSDGNVLSCKANVESDLTVKLLQSVERKDETFTADKTASYSVALDVGTTTLVASLIDEQSGKTVLKTAQLNPQGVLGADVLSRIQAYSEGNGTILHDLIVDKTQQILQGFTAQTGAKINELIVTANTTMLHIFLGVDPTPIGAYPFTPVFTCSKEIGGKELSLDATVVRLLPSASSYVGSDVVSGVLACNMHEDNDVTMLVDVGTNGEIVLKANGKMYGTSTAAGPALEGAGIECGLGGVAGAIDSVDMKEGKIVYTTIDGEPPTGICGSGIIDLIALLVREKIIDYSGTFDEESNSPLINNLLGERFYVTDKVYLSQKDVRQFQLAKSAIVAGMKTLLIEKNVPLSEVKKVYLAGGLGQYMSISSATQVGLLPADTQSVTVAVGNTALQGAIKCVASKETREKMDEIATSIEIVELSTSAVFQDEYVENMYFGSEE